MSEEQKSQSFQAKIATLDKEQLQVLLKETLKEKSGLVGKNTKLQGKYIELFKQQRELKKDHLTFVTFLGRFLNPQTKDHSQKLIFEEQPIGKYDLAELQKMGEQKNRLLTQRIASLENNLQLKVAQVRTQLQAKHRKDTEQIVAELENRIKQNRESQTKEASSLLKDIQNLKKVVKNQNEEVSQLKRSLSSKGEELSKLSKQKLKLQHHLNNIRKKEIAEELSPEKIFEEEKMQIDRNQFLSMRQQVEALLQKRDNLKRELKDAAEKLQQEKDITEALQIELAQLKRVQREFDEKYELVRECSLEQLQNMIVNHHSAADAPVVQKQNRGPSPAVLGEVKQDENEEIQRQYLKNVIVRYIKAESNGAIEQSLTLLEIIATLLKLDPESSLALQQYKLKRRQWWTYVLAT